MSYQLARTYQIFTGVKVAAKMTSRGSLLSPEVFVGLSPAGDSVVIRRFHSPSYRHGGDHGSGGQMLKTQSTLFYQISVGGKLVDTALTYKQAYRRARACLE